MWRGYKSLSSENDSEVSLDVFAWKKNHPSKRITDVSKLNRNSRRKVFSAKDNHSSGFHEPDRRRFMWLIGKLHIWEFTFCFNGVFCFFFYYLSVCGFRTMMWSEQWGKAENCYLLLLHVRLNASEKMNLFLLNSIRRYNTAAGMSHSEQTEAAPLSATLFGLRVVIIQPK